MKKYTELSIADAYAPSNGIAGLREAICQWYEYYYQVNLNYEKETIVTIGSKEGINHLALATCGPGDIVLVPEPCYPIHKYAFTIAGATVQFYPALCVENIVEKIKSILQQMPKKPKFLVLNFPSNPTTNCIDLVSLAKLVQLAQKEKFWILQDFAYADLTFEMERAPSILQVSGAKEVAVEFFTLSKSYNMSGWRIGFMSGNEKLVSALTYLKHYMDYGSYLPLQYAGIRALTMEQDFLLETRERYRNRRDILCANLAKIGWDVPIPKATMFVWAKIPEFYRPIGSLKFAQLLLEHAHVAVTPGACFGESGEEYVRFALIQDEQAIVQACEMMDKMFKAAFDYNQESKSNAA